MKAAEWQQTPAVGWGGSINPFLDGRSFPPTSSSPRRDSPRSSLDRGRFELQNHCSPIERKWLESKRGKDDQDS